MDGRAFLDTVHHLLAAPSEANLRSTAGPLYCALLNEARDALERWGFPVTAHTDVDAFVLSHFDTVPNMDLVRVGDPLIQLARYRNLADDSRSDPALFADDKEVKRLLGLARVAIDLLDQIESDPGRRAAAVSDIQKVFP